MIQSLHSKLPDQTYRVVDEHDGQVKSFRFSENDFHFFISPNPPKFADYQKKNSYDDLLMVTVEKGTEPVTLIENEKYWSSPYIIMTLYELSTVRTLII
jgi:hypothetical protein